jgi:hypothetical protein
MAHNEETAPVPTHPAWPGAQPPPIPMKKSALLLAAAALTGLASAQDLAISKIANNTSDFAYYGTSNGIAAYSMGTTSCNVGNQIVAWGNSQGPPPVIAQNFFKIQDGRIEQLGYSWMKEGFCAVNENSCGSCQSTPCNTLGIGCADTYGSGLNDGAFGVGKFRVDPVTGSWPASWGPGPTGPSSIRGRLQMPASELAQAGVKYFAESQYICEHDQLAGNGRNNVSYIEARYNSSSLSSLVTTGPITMFEPAIFAWKDEHPDVMIEEIVNTDEGGPGVHAWMFVASRATLQSNGKYRYDYAVQNLNSKDSIQAFSVPADCSPSNMFFRDVDHHSGSPWANTDWSLNQGGGFLEWYGETAAQNANANAIRWGTMFTFSFEADAQPGVGTASLTLFESGGVKNATVFVPSSNCCSGGDIAGYCTSNMNSASIIGAQLGATGSTNAGDNNLTLNATDLPLDKFCYMIMSQSQGFVANFGGSQGNLCLGAPFYRFSSNVMITAGGSVSFSPDFNSLPQNQTFLPGSTWNFQLWFRDNNPGPTSNTTTGVAVTFCQ